MAINTTFVSGAILTAAQQNALPFGFVGSAAVTTAQTGITSATDLTGFTLTFTAIANRKYMMIANLNPIGTVANYAQINLNINGSDTRYWRTPFVITGTFQSTTLTEVFTTTAGSCTVKLKMAQGGAATVGNFADGSFSCNMLIMDLGER